VAQVASETSKTRWRVNMLHSKTRRVACSEPLGGKAPKALLPPLAALLTSRPRLFWRH